MIMYYVLLNKYELKLEESMDYGPVK